MSDLYIESRLQAIKDIASASCSDIKDADNIAGFCDEIYSAIPKLDKVVEELKKELSLAKKEKEKCTGENHLQFYSTKGYAGGISYAIEVVKQGGADDVCEWTKIDEEGYKNCKCNYDETIPDFFKYCPYCGKKIKVVK